MSFNRTNPKAGWATKRDLETRGPNGRLLCRWCKVEVPKGCRTFCSAACVHEWKIRSDPAYVRQCLRKRDGGVCKHCSCNTIEIKLKCDQLRAISYPQYSAYRMELAALGFHWHRDTFWDAEHVVPVIEGGGECSLEGYITLCVPCHKKSTAALRKRLKDKKQNERQSNTAGAPEPSRLPDRNSTSELSERPPAPENQLLHRLDVPKRSDDFSHKGGAGPGDSQPS